MTQEHLFASFMLEKQTGLEIALHAENVIEATPVQGKIQPLPGGVDFLEGIMHLRDDVVPVINLKKRLGLADVSYNEDAMVAVVGLYDQRFGLLVEDINEVFRAEPAAVKKIASALQGGDRIISALIRMKSENRTAELLDLKNIFLHGVEDFDQDIGLESRRENIRQTTWSRFVVFRSGNQEYGVPVKYAREITFMTEIDEMFKSGVLEGALNLRGRTVPVMNAADLLFQEMELPSPPQEEQRILVLASEECSFGMIVDQVAEILTVADQDILSVPSRQGGSLAGIYARPSGAEVMLLDMPNLVCTQIEDLKSMSRLKNGNGNELVDSKEAITTSHHLITENCYLVFAAEKNFAIELKDVQEIIEDTTLLKVPGETGYRSGVINLRGEVVPVIDLRRFYNFSQGCGGSDESRLIICRGDDRTVALAVDRIITIYKQEQYHATPSLHPQLADKKDTLDRLIEFDGSGKVLEHVLVVNTYNLVRNYLLDGSSEA